MIEMGMGKNHRVTLFMIWSNILFKIGEQIRILMRYCVIMPDNEDGSEKKTFLVPKGRCRT